MLLLRREQKHKERGVVFMDIIILFLMTSLFYMLIVKKDTSWKVIMLWFVLIILSLILFKLHATSTLPISL